MCPESPLSPAAPEPSEMLARLMEKQLGYEYGKIDPIALRLFLKAYWSRVTALAHAIHEDECSK